MAFFLPLHITAELDACASLSLGSRKARPLQIISPELDMRAKLIFHVIRSLRTMKKLSGEGTKVGEEFHPSSGCAASAEPMAVASRFQLSVSSRRRLRPGAVSS